MPGREAVPRTGNANERRRPAGAPYDTALTSSRQKAIVQKPNQSKQPQEPLAVAPACETCLALLQSSQKVRNALETVLTNARIVFLDDTLHHQMDDERWVRVLRAIGQDKSMYYARNVTVKDPPH
ncbi:hypothetical protein TcG_04907 [Trypanosoma cruzi]|nr:hypothetical protein TcG_04907 [Trypanosoma cruzi]